MKKDKNGKQTPECRVDEIQLSMTALNSVAEKTDGAFDRQVETNWLLRDANMSLAIIVDMLGLYFSKALSGEIEKNEHMVQ